MCGGVTLRSSPPGGLEYSLREVVILAHKEDVGDQRWDFYGSSKFTFKSVTDLLILRII